MTTDDNAQDNVLPRSQLFLIIYISIFGVVWGLGTSILAGALPPDPITRAFVIGWFEAAIMIVAKIVVRHPLTVMFAITIASTISIFTFSFGPPNPYKPIFILAGLAFDAGTFFRTKNLRAWNIMLGSTAYIVVACLLFIAIFYLLDPALVPAVKAALPFAAGVFLVFAYVAALVLNPIIMRNPPKSVQTVWRRIGFKPD
jgi:hypothetical protein